MPVENAAACAGVSPSRASGSARPMIVESGIGEIALLERASRRLASIGAEGGGGGGGTGTAMGPG